MEERDPDLRTVLALFGVLAAATLFTGSRLQATTIPNGVLSFAAITWLLATTFIAAMSLCAGIAALGVGISTLARQPVPSWHSLARLAFDFSLWLLYWLGIWGTLFALSLVLFLEAQRSYSTLVAGVMACAAAAGSTVVVMKSLPRDLRTHMQHLNPYNRYGLVPGVLLFLAFSQFGYFVARSFYVFDLSLAAKELPATAPLRVEARVSGRVLNVDSLRVRVEPLVRQPIRCQPVHLESSGSGQLIGWISVAHLPPGSYRVVLFFENYEHASPRERLGLWYSANNHLVRTATFHVVPGA